MNVKYMFSLTAVVALILLAYVGVDTMGLKILFGIAVPYVALLLFVAGFSYKVMGWASSAVPFCIPSTCGQQKSLPWIKPNKIDNPFSKRAVVIRMILEVCCFRSLFRNTQYRLEEGPKHSYEWEKWLWLAALAFHYSFLVVLIRHMRFFIEPVPWFVHFLEKLDGFFQLGLPGLFLSGVILLAALIYLLLRRIVISQVNYISLASDYFPLFLIISIAITGILMRYFTKVDVVAVKELAMGVVTFHPVVPEGIGVLFYIHLFLVCILLMYFPFSKLMHLGGVFLSPTRNLPANTRAHRHVNPWDYPVKVHTYQEYEDDFRDKMIEAGLPVEKKE